MKPSVKQAIESTLNGWKRELRAGPKLLTNAIRFLYSRASVKDQEEATRLLNL